MILLDISAFIMGAWAITYPLYINLELYIEKDLSVIVSFILGVVFMSSFTYYFAFVTGSIKIAMLCFLVIYIVTGFGVNYAIKRTKRNSASVQ